MEMHSELRYNAAPDTVFAMLTNETFIKRKTMAANAVRYDVSVQRTGDGAVIALTRVMPPDVPDFVRRFVGETIDIKQVDSWGPAAPDGSRKGQIDLEMVGAPVTCKGQMAITPDGGGTTVTITGTLKAAIPLFGGRIEQAVLQGLMEVAKIEQRVGDEWISEGGA
jgi:hypothetical protein